MWQLMRHRLARLKNMVTISQNFPPRFWTHRLDGFRFDLIIRKPGASSGRGSGAQFCLCPLQWRRKVCRGFLVGSFAFFLNLELKKTFAENLDIPRDEIKVLYQSPDRKNIYEQRRFASKPIDVRYVVVIQESFY